ncbi:PHR1 [Symbiodinium sp. KB8]|nr:PHR1 [Symbiodinium sp. KB8]
MSGPVVYWMSRDQRADDNWALLYAQDRAITAGVPLVVVFNLVEEFLEATIRQFGFMLKGLREVATDLEGKEVPFVMLRGQAQETVPDFSSRVSASLVVSDFSALRIGTAWRRGVGSALQAAGIPLHEVDAHNIVPVWHASPKLEYAARTLRSKLHAQLPAYLTAFPDLQRHPIPWEEESKVIDWDAVTASLSVDRSVPEVAQFTPGPAAGRAALAAFVADLKGYAATRNDPVHGKQSELSPWFHFGNLAPQRAALDVSAARSGSNGKDVDAFIEEAVVRRELSDNYCYYNNDGYDRLDGLYPQFGNKSWAQESLAAHAGDKREVTYTQDELEQGQTTDDLWNAAQLQMVHGGKMQGFMRMYWAKKILEWTPSAEEALRIAIYLNDRYSLDGRDPNGYVGCAWSIGGVHDQGWRERPIFGKVRYMNYAGCSRKFDIQAYIRKVKSMVKKIRK